MANIIAFVRDSLTNMVASLGTSRDKAAANVYSMPMLTDEELLNAYRGAWLPKKIVDIPAFDSIRAWRDWQAKKPQIEAIEAEEKRLNVMGKLLETRIKARLWGGAALVIGTGDQDLAAPLEVERIGKGGLKYLTVMTRRHLTAGEIDRDPASEWYGKPKVYLLNSADGVQVEIHPSRLVVFNGSQQPDEDIVTTTYAGWGDSVLLSVVDAIKQADGTAANIASLVFEAKVNVIRIPDFMQNLGNAEYRAKILERYTLAATAKGINGDLLLDKEEEYEQKTANFATLPDVLMSFLQIVSGAADIPATRLLGQSPAGMNATGESDLRNYYDRLQAMQTVEMTPAMARLDECIIRSALGSRDPDIYYEWAPLWGMSEKEKAEVFKTKADAARQLVGSGTGQEIIPRDAVSDALVNTFIEDGSLPGLDAAIEEYGKLSEQEPDESEQRAAAGEEPDEKPKAITADAAPRTLYVSRKVLNADEIIAWAKRQGFKTTLPAEDLHVTITFSRTPVDWMKMGSTWEDEVKIPRGGARLVEKFGEARVLMFVSNMLSWRHEEMVDRGASWDHSEYQPHITISYDDDVPDLAKVEPYQGEIMLGPERFEEVAE
ncbi:DUF1073 domain-containing protein [Sinorhizobium meliloti]|nr:DUF1073 domain-containing protein [Sinorhizobium meliloti]